jgi:glutathione S-transferase
LALPTLHYFQFRGRALACRVALFNALGTDGWKDQRLSLPRFKKERALSSSSLPDHTDDPCSRVRAEYITDNLPQLNLPCGLKVSQSHAIARYAGKLSPPARDLPDHYVPDLYPRDPKKALLVDEVVAVVDQILLLTPKDEDAETRARKREAYHTSGFLRVGMELLEGRLEESGGPFILGEDISIADLYIRAPLGDLFDLGQFDGVPKEFYGKFGNVQRCAEAVPEHSLLKAYHEQYKN